MRKLFVIVLSVVILATLGLVYVRHTAAYAAEDQEVYIVEKGDTLWAIASRFAPRSMDVRDYIYRLRAANNLTTSATIHPGQELILPKR